MGLFQLVTSTQEVIARHAPALGAWEGSGRRTMAATPADGREVSITVVPPTESSEEQQRESISADIVEGKLKTLNRVVFCVAFWEWAGNAVGTLAFLWATVVLLGGFSSLLSRMDFWFATVMVFVEGSKCVARSVIKKELTTFQDIPVNLFMLLGAFRLRNHLIIDCHL